MPEEREPARKLRPKEKKVYTDDIDEEEIEGGPRTFSVEDKLQSDAFDDDKHMLRHLDGADVTVKYFQENGFKYPILVKNKEGLGMRVPGENFTVTDVKQCVGSRRMIDVMDVTTQKGEEMTMKQWAAYYLDTDHRDRLLNVISLEFSHTRLENYVEQPAVVKQMDWVETVWPTFLKDSQLETTNIIEKMKYPKVQKYVLMSVAGCYTDFHIDMGGTSVWYHILHGGKVFWLIPPTTHNLDLFEKWVKSGRQSDTFFGDKAEDCIRITLTQGNTFFIPTGWIHAVYTPKDSLVFGGNFLHSINIDLQLSIWDIESRTHVPFKFRYPFFTEIHWYTLDRYLSCVCGRSYRAKSAEELKAEREDAAEDEDKQEDDDDMYATPPRTPADDDSSSVSSVRGRHTGPPSVTDDSRPGTPTPSGGGGSSSGRRARARPRGATRADLDRIRPVSVKLQNCLLMDKNKLMSSSATDSKKAWVHLTQYELAGLQTTVEWCEKLPPTKKLVPKDISDPDGLLADIKQMIKDHLGDNPIESLTGDMAIKWPVRKKQKPKVRGYTTTFARRPKAPKGSGAKPVSNPNRRRRVRCRKCEPCTRQDCELCSFCRDMKKYGGPGRMKQSCISRQCIRPELPKNISCILCGGSDNPEPDALSDDLPTDTLLECGICWDITHPRCLAAKLPTLSTSGVVNEDLPHSWECPRCLEDGKQGWTKPRQVKGTVQEHSQYQTHTLAKFSKKSTSPSSSLADSDAENKAVVVNRVTVPGIRDNARPNGNVLGKPVVNGNGLDENKTSTKRHRSLWDDFDIPSPPTKVLKVELSPLKGYPLPKQDSLLLVKADLSIERSPVKLSPIPTLPSPPRNTRRGRSPIKRSPVRTRRSSSVRIESRNRTSARTHSLGRLSSRSRVHSASPSKLGRRRNISPRKSPAARRSVSPVKSVKATDSGEYVSPTRVTSRGREINLPSRFLR